MSDKSSIEWTDASWNPTRGCTKIAQGCKHCYAETFAERFRGVPGHPYEQGFDPRLAPDKLAEPLKWKKPRRIFVDSMSDLFHESFPDEYLDNVFAVMGQTLRHTFQVLTKRPERAAAYLNDPDRHFSILDQWVRMHKPSANVSTLPWPLPNVHIGTSIAEQKDADRNIPYLLQIPAAVRFLSAEPLIGPVDLTCVEWRRENGSDYFDALASERTAPDDVGLNGASVDWVIVGGESGPGARPCNVEWIRSIIAQCGTAAVPCFVKQLGAKPEDRTARGLGPGVASTAYNVRWQLKDRKGGDWSEWPADLRVREFPQIPGESEVRP